MRVAVLTISDSVSRGEREDLSGPAVVAFCRGLNWEIVETLRVSDDLAAVREQLRGLADSGRLDLISPPAERESARVTMLRKRRKRLRSA